MAIVVVVSAFMFVTGMSVTVSHLISSEVVVASRAVMFVEVFAAMRVFAVIAVAAIVVPIDVAPKVAVTMEPGTRADKDAVCEPLGSVVAVRRAIVRRVIEVAVGALGRRTDLDCNLRLSFLRRP